MQNIIDSTLDFDDQIYDFSYLFDSTLIYDFSIKVISAKNNFNIILFWLFLMFSELFDVGPRPPAMALGSMANWTGNFLVGITFPSLEKVLNQYSFLLFAGSTALLTLFV